MRAGPRLFNRMPTKARGPLKATLGRSGRLTLLTVDRFATSKVWLEYPAPIITSKTLLRRNLARAPSRKRTELVPNWLLSASGDEIRPTPMSAWVVTPRLPMKPVVNGAAGNQVASSETAGANGTP